MTCRTLVLAGLSVLALTLAATAEIAVKDAYARSSSPIAKAGAIFMEITNSGPEDDRLIGVQTDASARAELHTHIAGDNGVMRMREVEDGFAIPAGGSHRLNRGGDHVMLMGLTEGFKQGMSVPVVLVFEKAGEILVDVPVDLERQEVIEHEGMDHSGMGHGARPSN